MVAPLGTLLLAGVIVMDHIERRIYNFIKYRPEVNVINFGDFITEAPANPEKFKKDFWAVNCSLDQFPDMTLSEIIKKYDFQLTCAFMVSCHELVEKYRHLNFRYFPYFIAEGIAQIKVNNDYENPPISFDKRNNILSCVNRFARFHRIYTVYKLSQRTALAGTRVSFTCLDTHLPDENGHLYPINLSLDTMLDVARQRNYYSEHFESWLRNNYPTFPWLIEEQDNTDNKYDNWVKSEAFSNSYANIVTETYVESFLPTEKVVKPLLAGCLIMPAAGQFYMKKLERMGFDLQFSSIDYTLYDNLPSWQDRVDQVVDLADKIYPDIESIWQANILRLKHNRELFFSKALEEHVIQDVHDIFELNY